MNTNTISDVLKAHPEFKYEAAKNEGYSDKEIIEFLSNYSKENTVDYIEVSIGNHIETFGHEHPYYFYTILTIFSGFLLWMSWKFTLTIIKSLLYQISYAIKKGINDANNKKN